MNSRLSLAACLLLVSACGRQVSTGVDVLVHDDFQALDGTRVGLITNHTGIARNGQSTIQILHDAPNVELVRIFSPEHGLEGRLDIPVIEDGTDAGTGIPVISLYGETRTPLPATLEDIDAIVFDIQDIGTRFYTYISTMGNAMIAASFYDVRFVVLDRPNPINGIDVAGPVVDEDRLSFTAFHTLPVRHGMTVGELALMINDELELGLNLEVVRMKGWRRGDFYDDTGLEWINPSPNMRSLTEALLYPGIGLLETTNLSVGRGTATPFEWIGAPWLDGERLARQLNELDLPGIAFDAVTFTPDSSKFANEVCHGVRFTITDRNRFDPLETGLEIALHLARDYRRTWDIDAYLRLLGNLHVLHAVAVGEPLTEIRAMYRRELVAFSERRARYLLYD